MMADAGVVARASRVALLDDLWVSTRGLRVARIPLRARDAACHRKDTSASIGTRYAGRRPDPSVVDIARPWPSLPRSV
jgi:hypothetical protein